MGSSIITVAKEGNTNSLEAVIILRYNNQQKVSEHTNI